MGAKKLEPDDRETKQESIGDNTENTNLEVISNKGDSISNSVITILKDLLLKQNEKINKDITRIIEIIRQNEKATNKDTHLLKDQLTHIKEKLTQSTEFSKETTRFIETLRKNEKTTNENIHSLKKELTYTKEVLTKNTEFSKDTRRNLNYNLILDAVVCFALSVSISTTLSIKIMNSKTKKVRGPDSTGKPVIVLPNNQKEVECINKEKLQNYINNQSNCT